MKLTKTHRKLLKFYTQHRTTPPTLWSVVRSFALSWAFLAGVITASTWFIWAGWPVVTWLYIGVFIGVILRDIGRIRLLFQTWPLVHAVLDWERVEKLAASDETNAPDDALVTRTK